MITPDLQKKAMIYLGEKDAKLKKVIEEFGQIEWTEDESYFYSLVTSTIGQQLSSKAADTIWKRFEKLLKGQRLAPDIVLAIPDQAIRDAGVSWSKIKYIKDLASKVIESGIIFEQFDIMTDEEIITELIKVKGIGRWTAEMFLIFNMQRPDVFSYGDLGLRRAIRNIYHLDHEPTPEEAEKISSNWKPFRSIASRYLWLSLDVKLANH
ncbi:MAG TPA: DNA-3-methyladenine glycosylase 2 family protein [Patescibacteria group bacterium]|nr:DNA-3-methyladenine glycosylase 2 family protein [Patescibacteria group bacterium]